MKKILVKSIALAILIISIIFIKNTNAQIVGEKTDKVTVGLYTNMIDNKVLIIVNPNESFKYDASNPQKNALYKSDLQNFLSKNNITISAIKNSEGSSKKDDEKLATGDILVSNNSEEYHLVIYGDTNGSATVCDASDIRAIIEDYVYNKKLTGIYKIATDVNRDSKINSIDVSRMINKYLGKNIDGGLVKQMPSEDSKQDDPDVNPPENPPTEEYSMSSKIANKTLAVGEKTKITTTIYPSTADQSVSYLVEKSGIVEVDNEGNVTAIGEGTTTITIKSTKYNDLQNTLNVQVSKNIVHVEKIDISIEYNNENKTINVGDTAQIVTTITPSNATDKSVTFSSSNTSVATVDQNGKVTGIGDGTAIIYAKVTDGGATASLTVNVTSQIKITGYNVTWIASIPKGGTAQQTVTLTPSNATNKTLKWTSSNTSVATVDENGKVTGVGEGKAIIKFVTTDGSNFSSQKEITVY